MAVQNKPKKRYSEGQWLDFTRRIGRSLRTLKRWKSEGCDLEDPESVKKWLREKEVLRPGFQRIREESKRPSANLQPTSANSMSSTPEPNGNLPPAGKRGAAAALERLEHQEEESHRRLQVALQRGDPVQIQAAEEFWLRCSEVLRRLDLAIETSRRSEQTMIPLSVAESAVLASAEWLRIATMQFLSSETSSLMGLRDSFEFRAYFLERFCGIVKLTVKNAAKTNSAVPIWAEKIIHQAWNIE